MDRPEQTALAQRQPTPLVEQRKEVNYSQPSPAPEEPRRDGAHDHPQQETRQQDHHEEIIPKDLPRPSNFAVMLAGLSIVLLLAAVFLLGYFPHRRAEQRAREDARSQSSGNPVVQVIHPRPEAAGRDIVLPCDVKPNQTTALYSRANGFLKSLNFDVGQHVEAGKVMAVIDTPETDAQLAEARATVAQGNSNVAKSQADMQLAAATLSRYTAAQKQSPGSVNQEDVDTRKSAYEDAAAAVAVAKANVVQQEAAVQRLVELQKYEKIYAPFSGTITARNYDIGALLNPSDTGPGKEVFDLAAIDTLRASVNVPQSDATNIHVGQDAFLKVRNYPTREFKGVVARTTGAIDPSSRTLTIELDFDNSQHELYAGMYGEARLRVTDPHPVLVIPSSALIFNANGLQLAIVHGNKVKYQAVTVGRDYGTEIEITTGLVESDQVVTNPGERLGDNVEVDVKMAPATHP